MPVLLFRAYATAINQTHPYASKFTKCKEEISKITILAVKDNYGRRGYYFETNLTTVTAPIMNYVG